MFIYLFLLLLFCFTLTFKTYAIAFHNSVAYKFHIAFLFASGLKWSYQNNVPQNCTHKLTFQHCMSP